MAADKLAKYRERLLNKRAELRALEDTLNESGGTVELDQSRVGRLSRMDAMQAQQMALEASRRRKRQLVAIDAALGRIDVGDFGACFVCGEDIDARRLAIDPTSTRCLGCLAAEPD